tara:strand:- start:37 stop:555 length:519 start_codon:yes stop_codon:yes gene_type:complete
MNMIRKILYILTKERRLPQLPKNIKIIIGIIFIFIIYKTTSTGSDYKSAYVSKVIDGDTIEIDYKSANIRLLGINTPETKHPHKREECFGQEASIELRKMIEGKKVKLDFNGKGKYDRDLVYVYINNKSINEHMISEGFAYHSKYPHKYEKKYAKLENKAKKKKKGLWRYCY